MQHARSKGLCNTSLGVAKQGRACSRDQVPTVMAVELQHPLVMHLPYRVRSRSRL